MTDNGIGFTDANLHSFGQAYSAKKQKLGGKGIGRFAMLSFCNSIDVESVIETNKGNIKRALRLNRIEGLVKEEDKNTEEMRRTTVLLNNILEKYRKVSSKYSHEMLADAILSHCLLYYLDSNAPSIEIMEDNTIIKLDNQFNKSDFVLSQASRMLKNRTFTLYFVKSAKKSHCLSFCANHRKVRSKKLSSILPVFSSPIKIGENDIYFDIYMLYLNILMK